MPLDNAKQKKKQKATKKNIKILLKEKQNNVRRFCALGS